MAISPYSETDDDKIFALTCARKNARTDADAAAIAWAEEEIETLRRERDDAVRALNAKDRAASTVARGVDLGVKLCPLRSEHVKA